MGAGKLSLTREQLERLHQFVLVAKLANDYEESWKCLLEFVLYDQPTPWTSLATGSFLNAGFGFVSLTDKQTREYLDMLANDGRVTRSESSHGVTYVLTQKRKNAIRQRIAESKRIRQGLEHFLIAEVTKSLRITTGIKRSIRDTLPFFFALYLDTRSVAVLSQLPEAPTTDVHGYLQCVTLSAQHIRQKELREPYARALRTALERPEFSEYLHLMLDRYIRMCVMRAHPSVDSFRAAFFDGATLYLDTNVLLNLLLERRRFHSVMKSICEYMRELDFSVYVSKHTVEEFDSLLGAADRSITRGDNPDPQSWNAFIRDFSFMRSHTTWDDYYLSFKQGLRTSLAPYRIEIDVVDYTELIHTDDYSDIQNAIKQAINRLNSRKLSSTIRHDALLLTLIKHFRDNSPKGSKRRIYFLTGDLTLYSACKSVGATSGGPLAVMADIWLELLFLFPLRDQQTTIDLAYNIQKSVTSFLTSPHAESLPPLSQTEIKKILKPVLSGNSYQPEELFARAEEKVLRNWINDPHEQRLKQRLEEVKDGVLELEQKTLEKQADKINQLRKQVARLRTGQIVRNSLITPVLTGIYALVTYLALTSSIKWLKSGEARVSLIVLISGIWLLALGSIWNAGPLLRAAWRLLRRN